MEVNDQTSRELSNPLPNTNSQKSGSRHWAWIAWLILAIAGAVAIGLNPLALNSLVEISSSLIVNLEISVLGFVIAVALGWAMACLLRRPGWSREVGVAVVEPLYAFPPYLLLFAALLFMPLVGLNKEFFLGAAALGLGHSARVAMLLREIPLVQAGSGLARRAVSLIRDSSMISIIGLLDSVRRARYISQSWGDFITPHLVLLYVWAVFILALHTLVRVWENLTPTTQES